MYTDPEVGPFDRKIEELRGIGGANVLRENAVDLGSETDTKFAPSKSLGVALQVKPESEYHRDALQTDESNFAEIDKELRPKYFPPIKCREAPVAGGMIAAKEEMF